ncbi:MAG: hypothetical protein A2076_03065 [Geobacteraceae bacterium GWC2_53_11]|nr:MAG: hypothetical protein A2076_03065 [Geobacteraceae bacterium GWC2_53_11]
MTGPVRIGVSACLLGEYVRYDGEHKLDLCITGVIAKFFALVPICPEVGCGLPTPREAMRLEGEQDAPRLMTVQTRIDRTGQMLDYCAAKLGEFGKMDLCGFVFKERSPSCGISAVPLYTGADSVVATAGLFAREIRRRFPLMPLEEAERLNNPEIRERFIESVFLYHRAHLSAVACRTN